MADPIVIGPEATEPVVLGVAPAMALILDNNGNGKPVWADSADAIEMATAGISFLLKALPAAGPVYELVSFVAAALPALTPVIEGGAK